MEMIPHIYIILLPLLLAGYFFCGRTGKKYMPDILSTLNLLILLFSFYSARRLIGIIQLLRSLNGNNALAMPLLNWKDEFVLMQAGRVLLPLFFLIPAVRKNFIFSGLVYVLFFWSSTFLLTDMATVFSSIAYCMSLFAATFALLWLLKKQPSQNCLN